MSSEQVQDDKMMLTPASFEATLRYFAESPKGITFMVYYEQVGHPLSCTINNEWEIHGVTVNSKEISFISSKRDGPLIRYQARGPEYISCATKWFQDAAKQLKPSEKFTLLAVLPKNLIFRAGVTELLVTSAEA